MAYESSTIVLLLFVILASTSGTFFFGSTNTLSNNHSNNRNNIFGRFGNSAGTPFNTKNQGSNADTPFSSVINTRPNNQETTPSNHINTPTNNIPSNMPNNTPQNTPSNTVNNVLTNNFEDSLNQRCNQRSARDFRPHKEDCSKFTMCSRGNLIAFECPKGSVFHDLSGSCVPRGSDLDTCSPKMASQMMCPPGAKYKKAHPQHCARYYHCGEPAQQQHWENHLKECGYPMLYNEQTERCEHYTMVLCGARKEPLDPCEYMANDCNGHANCVPCKIRHPSCRNKKDGMNAWKGREGSPYYVVCANQRVVYNGMCSQTNGIQVFDVRQGVCKMLKNSPW